MKTLVYENYNKFISATDTIRQMKHNVVNMEEEMHHLSESMKQITSLSSNINTTLGPNREVCSPSFSSLSLSSSPSSKVPSLTSLSLFVLLILG